MSVNVQAREQNAIHAFGELIAYVTERSLVYVGFVHAGQALPFLYSIVSINIVTAATWLFF